MLTTGDAAAMDLTVWDSNGVNYPDVIIKIDKFFSGTGTYGTVAAPKTSSAGTTNTYLKLYDTKYRFTLLSNTTTLAVKDERTIGTQILTLQADPTIDVPSLDYWTMSSSCDYDNQTFFLKCDYNDDSGYMESIKLEVFRIASLSVSYPCTNTSTTIPSGYITCTVGNISTAWDYKYSLIATLTTGDTWVLKTEFLSEGVGGVSLIFGNCRESDNLLGCQEGLFLAFLLVLGSAMFAFYSPPAAIGMATVGFVLCWAIGLIALSITTVFGLVFVGVVALYSMRKRGEN